jgi:hypothetical protein
MRSLPAEADSQQYACGILSRLTNSGAKRGTYSLIRNGLMPSPTVQPRTTMDSCRRRVFPLCSQLSLPYVPTTVRRWTLCNASPLSLCTKYTTPPETHNSESIAKLVLASFPKGRLLIARHHILRDQTCRAEMICFQQTIDSTQHKNTGISDTKSAKRGKFFVLLSRSVCVCLLVCDRGSDCISASENKVVHMNGLWVTGDSEKL